MALHDPPPDPTEAPRAPAAQELVTTPTLRTVMVRGRPRRVDVALGWQPVDIGRAGDASAGVVLDDPRVSRRHATVQRQGTQLQLHNHSQHGTFVNGTRVDTARGLHDGDVVRVGDSFLVVRQMPLAPVDADIPELRGDAPDVAALRARIARVAPGDASVLICGETGTGKELVAHALHRLSGRAGPLVAVNCSAIPADLAEATLFGAQKGAYTGAVRDALGLVRQAERGTLFLDEIGELPLALQPKLLRFLEDKRVQPVGASTAVAVDVRIVSATNVRLEEAVESGRFRRDLFARIAVASVETSPLRNRREDILALLEGFLPGRELDPELAAALLVHPWPLNVRGLKVLAAEGALLQASAPLGPALLRSAALRPASPPTPGAAAAVHADVVTVSERGVSAADNRAPPPTRDAMEALLTKWGGSVSAIARATGRSRAQVYRDIAAHGLDAAKYR